MQFSSIWHIDRTLSGVTILSHSEPVSDGNEGVLRIPQSSSISGSSPSDCLVSYPGHLWEGVFYSPSWLGKQIAWIILTSCLNKVKEPSLPNYLLKAEERRERFKSILRALALYEMQITSYRTWIWLVDSISSDSKNISFLRVLVSDSKVRIMWSILFGAEVGTYK